MDAMEIGIRVGRDEMAYEMGGNEWGWRLLYDIYSYLGSLVLILGFGFGFGFS